jgi:hypothetical protein
MRDVLSEVLASPSEDSVDRILAAAFFRKRPLQAGCSAHVISLADRPRGAAFDRSGAALGLGRSPMLKAAPDEVGIARSASDQDEEHRARGLGRSPMLRGER